MVSSVDETQRRGGQDILILLASQALVTTLGVLHQGLLAYTLLPEGRGVYAICFLFGSLLGVLFTPGAGRGSQHFVMARRISLSQGVSIALTISVVGGGLAVACGIPLVLSGLSLFGKADSRLLLLALSLIPLTSFSAAMALMLDGRRRFARLAVFFSMRSIVAVIMVVVLVRGFSLGVGGAIIALMLSHFTLIAACVFDLVKNCGLVWELPTRSGVARSLGYGLRHHVVQVGAIVDERLGSLLLSLTSSLADIGFFSTGSAMMARVLAVPYSISTAVQPRITAAEAGRPELTAFCARLGWWATGATLAVLLAISEPLVRILFSEAFSPVVSLMWILAIGIVVYSGADLFMAYFRGINRPQICSLAFFLGLAANVVSFFALFPLAGLEAAAWAMTIGLVTRSVFLVAAYCRATGMGLLATCVPRRGDIVYLRHEVRLVLGRLPTVRQFRN